MAVPFCRKSSLDKIKYVDHLITLISEWVDTDPFLWFRCGLYMGESFYMLDQFYNKKSCLPSKWYTMLYHVYYRKGSENFSSWWLSWVEYIGKKESFFQVLEYNNIENIFTHVKQEKLILDDPFDFSFIVLAEWLFLVSENHSYCAKLQTLADAHKESMKHEYYYPFHVMIYYSLLHELGYFNSLLGSEQTFLHKIKQCGLSVTSTPLMYNWIISRLTHYFQV